MDLTPSVARLDNFCDLFAGVARDAAARGCPDHLAKAAERLARQLEELAGTIDTAGDPTAARAALAGARSALPPAFEAFGRAVAENLLAGSQLRPRRRRRDPATGELVAIAGVPENYSRK